MVCIIILYYPVNTWYIYYISFVFNFTDFKSKDHNLVWQDRKDIIICRMPDTDIPYFCLSKIIYDCEHGPIRKKRRISQSAKEVW